MMLEIRLKATIGRAVIVPAPAPASALVEPTLVADS